MTTTLTIPPGERGTVRLFAIDLPPGEARAFADDPAAVARALGAPDLDLRHIDVFPVSRIAPLGLAAFLTEGHGIPARALAPTRTPSTRSTAMSPSSRRAPSARRGASSSRPAAPPRRRLGRAAPAGHLRRPARGRRGRHARRPGRPPPPAPRPGGGMRRILTVLLLILAIVGFIVLNGGQ
jgi:hypothetical protein